MLYNIEEYKKHIDLLQDLKSEFAGKHKCFHFE